MDGELSTGEKWSNHKMDKIYRYISRSNTFYIFTFPDMEPFLFFSESFFRDIFFMIILKKNIRHDSRYGTRHEFMTRFHVSHVIPDKHTEHSGEYPKVQK